MTTKEDIQARYLRGEINYDAYQKLLARAKMVNDEKKAEEYSGPGYISRREQGKRMRQSGAVY